MHACRATAHQSTCNVSAVLPFAPQSTEHKLETEVLAPLHRWQEVYMQLGVSTKRAAASLLPAVCLQPVPTAGKKPA